VQAQVRTADACKPSLLSRQQYQLLVRQASRACQADDRLLPPCPEGDHWAAWAHFAVSDADSTGMADMRIAPPILRPMVVKRIFGVIRVIEDHPSPSGV